MSDLITVESIGAITRIAPQGHLNASNAARLRQEMAEEIAEKSPQLVLDFSAVEFIDSMALGAIANAAVMVRERTGKVVLCALNASVRRAFEITQLHRVLEIVADLDAAAQSLLAAPVARSAGAGHE